MKTMTCICPMLDGLAREKGTLSINECLETGPNLVELIHSIIKWFRLIKIGAVANIKKALLQTIGNNSIQITRNEIHRLFFYTFIGKRWKFKRQSNLLT